MSAYQVYLVRDTVHQVDGLYRVGAWVRVGTCGHDAQRLLHRYRAIATFSDLEMLVPGVVMSGWWLAVGVEIVGWWDIWWDGGMVGWWDGEMVGWWGGGVVRWLVAD